MSGAGPQKLMAEGFGFNDQGEQIPVIFRDVADEIDGPLPEIEESRIEQGRVIHALLDSLLAPSLVPRSVGLRVLGIALLVNHAEVRGLSLARMAKIAGISKQALSRRCKKLASELGLRRPWRG